MGKNKRIEESISQVKHLIEYQSRPVNEFNGDQSVMQGQRKEFLIGDWVQVSGDYIQAVEYNPRLRKDIMTTTFSSNDNNPGSLEIVSKDNQYWVLRTDDGRYYKIGNRMLTDMGNFKKLETESVESEEMIDEGVRELFNDLKGNLKRGAITVAAVLGMMQVNAQEPAKNGQLLDTISKYGDDELLKGLSDATGIQWDKATANRLFKFSPDEEVNKESLRELPNLDLGAYGKIGVAKLIKPNRTKGEMIKYTVDITDKRYLSSGKIFDEIKSYNDGLSGVEINFTYKGTPLPTKTIKI